MKAASWIVVSLGVVAVLLSRWICDDIFITLRYVQNVLDGIGIVYNAGEYVEGYSHPLWLALVALFSLAGFQPEHIAVLLGAVAYVGLLVVCAAMVRNDVARLTVLVALVIHHDFRVWATGGLETMAFTLAVTSAFLLYVRGVRLFYVGLILAAAVLLRADGAVFYLVFLVFALAEKRKVLELLAPAVLILAHLFWRYSYYGDLLPNPYYAKSAGEEYFSQGFYYILTYIRVYWSLPLALLVGLVFVRDNRIKLALSLILSYLVLFVAKVGGDFMYARFVIPVVPLGFLVLAFAAERLEKRYAVILVSVVIALALTDSLRRESLFAGELEGGIVDEHVYYTRDIGGGQTMISSQQKIADALRPYLNGESYKVLLRGQAALAYYSRFPYAFEALTSRELARSPTDRGVRGRVGHEKNPSFETLKKMGVNFVFMRRPYVERPLLAWFPISATEAIRAEVFHVDTVLFSRLQQKGVVFTQGGGE